MTASEGIEVRKLTVRANGTELYSEQRGNGETFLLEDAAYPCYRPEAAVAAIKRPVRVLVGQAGAPWATSMAASLAGLLGTQVITVPGGHGAYLDDPEHFARALRPDLRQITSASTAQPAPTPRPQS